MFTIELRSLMTPEGEKYWQFMINDQIISADLYYTQADAMKAANEVINELSKNDRIFRKGVGRDF